MACDSCHNRKVKCNPENIPCDRCEQAGMSCTFLRSSALSEETVSPPPQPGTTMNVGNNGHFDEKSLHPDSVVRRLLSSEHFASC